ncbi:MAG: 2-oxo acid dehydrogenase subunit E2 [Acidobacteriota bacterium]|jgi:pyruvate dehydrogenase E2 component (dihydrolipoamide acetyltransferase)|nr:2-oxo acid dehydrogenase subunit E2 [Acidobacteriota bacterium]
MAVEVVMPKLGLTMTEGLVVNWLKNEGDAVKKGDGLLEIETEKLTNVVESPADGVLLKAVGRVGESLPIRAVLAYVGAPGEAVPEAAASAPVAAAAPEPAAATAVAPPAVTGKGGRVFASPAARALARKLGIDYTRVAGTGPGGRIVKKDVADYGAAAAAASAAAAVAAPAVATTRPYAGMRKAVGDGMLASWSQAPMVTHHMRADVAELLALREQLNRDLGEGEVKVGVLDLLAKIVARAIKDHPIVNATLCHTPSGGEIRIPGAVNLGIAVAVENGLVVPVVRDAGGKSLFAVSREIKELTAKARAGRLRRDEMSGGTFTISNVGGYGSVDFFTPIVNQPESAILGVGRTVETPVARNGEVVIRPLTGISLTFDHRVIDGAPAAEFLATLQRHLARPARAVFEG